LPILGGISEHIVFITIFGIQALDFMGFILSIRVMSDPLAITGVFSHAPPPGLP